MVLDIIDNDNCASYIERDHRKLRYGLTEQQMCAGVLTGGKDTCQVSLLKFYIKILNAELSQHSTCFSAAYPANNYYRQCLPLLVIS